MDSLEKRGINQSTSRLTEGFWPTAERSLALAFNKVGLAGRAACVAVVIRPIEERYSYTKLIESSLFSVNSSPVAGERKLNSDRYSFGTL